MSSDSNNGLEELESTEFNEFDYEIKMDIANCSSRTWDSQTSTSKLHRWTANRPWFEDSADLLIEVRDKLYPMHSIMLFGKTEEEINNLNNPSRNKESNYNNTTRELLCPKTEHPNLRDTSILDSVDSVGSSCPISNQLKQHMPMNIGTECEDEMTPQNEVPPVDYSDRNVQVTERFMEDIDSEYNSYSNNQDDVMDYSNCLVNFVDHKHMHADPEICDLSYPLNQQRIVLPRELECASFELYAAYVYNGCPANITCTDCLNSKKDSEFRGAMGDGSEQLSLGQVVGLYKVACSMGCHSLVERLSNLISPKLGVHLALDMWSYGVRNPSPSVCSTNDSPAKQMTETCRQYVMRNANEVLQLDACLELEADHLMTILQDNRLNATEITVARFALAWTDHRTTQPTTDGDNQTLLGLEYTGTAKYNQNTVPLESDRAMLLSCPRYETMRISEITKHVYRHPAVKRSLTLRKLLEYQWLKSKVREATLCNGMTQLVPSQLMKIRPRVSPHQVCSILYNLYYAIINKSLNSNYEIELLYILYILLLFTFSSLKTTTVPKQSVVHIIYDEKVSESSF